MLYSCESIDELLRDCTQADRMAVEQVRLLLLAHAAHQVFSLLLKIPLEGWDE